MNVQYFYIAMCKLDFQFGWKFIFKTYEPSHLFGTLDYSGPGYSVSEFI